MKNYFRKAICIGCIFWIMWSTQLFSYTERELDAAKVLSKAGVIEDKWDNISEYKLDSSITRREMAKIMSYWFAQDVCTEKFSDLSTDDWGCKYAEYILSQRIISENTHFRPDDNITQIEALKMASKTYLISKDESESDWRAGYVSAWISAWIIGRNYFEYDKIATRWWIFDLMNKHTVSPGLESGEIVRIKYSLMWAKMVTTVFDSGKIIKTDDIDASENMDINISKTELTQIHDSMDALSRVSRLFDPQPGVLYDGGFWLYLVYEDETVYHSVTDEELNNFLELINSIIESYK